MNPVKTGDSTPLASPAQRWAIPMIIGSTLLISVNGLIIRSIESANEWQIVLYRQLFFVPALLLVLACQYRTRLPGLFLNVGWAGVGAAVSMVHKTGQPVVFVGTGQKYTHLRRLNVRTVIKCLFKKD